jgi:hypothetical protein
MKKHSFQNSENNFFAKLSIALACIIFSLILVGCGGYSNQSLYPQDIDSVCLQMFENDSFRRGIEYELSDALAKRIEAQTPYKIISSRDRADTVISGKLTNAYSSVLTLDRETGRAIEKEVRLIALVKWQNLKTGELLMDNVPVTASASFSEWQNQSFDYAASLAANKLAQRIVEMMEKKW